MNTRTITAQALSKWHYANPVVMIQNMYHHRELIWQFTKRQVLQRYKGSYLGVFWSFATPLAMLLVYTFVFSVIFQGKWNVDLGGGHAEFAVILFAGMTAFALFSDTVTPAPNLIINQVNYVKKVVFPLEVLIVSHLGSVLIHSGFSLIILLLGTLFVLGYLPWTIIFLPLVYVPLSLFSLGLGWFFASLGVFIRDIGHLLSIVVQMLFFLTPIFYPASIIPDWMSLYIYINPLTFLVEQFRRVAIFGQMPEWSGLGGITLLTMGVCLLGYIWFMTSKRAFADVL